MNDPLTSETFAIGEIAIMCNSEFFPENDGQECTIVDGLEWRQGQLSGELRLTYRVQRTDGALFLNMPHQLRKKRPPREDLQVTRWSECPWQPESIHV